MAGFISFGAIHQSGKNCGQPVRDFCGAGVLSEFHSRSSNAARLTTYITSFEPPRTTGPSNLNLAVPLCPDDLDGPGEQMFLTQPFEIADVCLQRYFVCKVDEFGGHWTLFQAFDGLQMAGALAHMRYTY